MKNDANKPRRTRWFVMAVCFALGLAVGWFAADDWLSRLVG